MFKTVNDGKLPTRASKYSAGVDVYANEDVIIEAGETKIVPLGIKIDMEFIKEMYIEDTLYDWNDMAIIIAKNIYPKEYKEWLENVLSGVELVFEFEYFNNKPLTEEILKEVEEARKKTEYCRIRFNINKYNDFMSSHYIALKPRSSLRAKGLISHTGVIDLDYPDEIKMIVHNPITDYFVAADESSCFLGAEDEAFITIHKGDKIGQLLLMEHKSYLFDIESEDERIGGFGSSGVR